METNLLKRRLIDVSDRLHRLLDDLAANNEEVDFYENAADDARMDALVAETPISDARSRDVRQRADLLLVQRESLVQTINDLRAEQDLLLDRMSEAMTPN